MENIGAKLVRQAASKTNDLAGDGTTTSVVLAQGLIAEGVKVFFISLMPLPIMFCTRPINFRQHFYNAFRWLQLVQIPSLSPEELKRPRKP